MHIESSQFTSNEARDMVQAINAGMEGVVNTLAALVKFYDGRGWLSLGYATWAKCVEKEFPQWTLRRVQQIISSRKTIALLENVRSPSDDCNATLQNVPKSEDEQIVHGAKLEKVSKSEDEPMVHPPREGVLRELSKAPPDRVKEVYAKAKTIAKPNKPPTAKDVAKARAEVAKKPAAEPKAAGKSKIRPEVAEILATREFDEIQGDLEDVRRRIKRLENAPAGRCLKPNTMAEIEAAIKTVWQILKFAAPENICPYCATGNRHCTACDGSGWVSLLTWRSAPKEMQEMVEAIE